MSVSDFDKLKGYRIIIEMKSGAMIKGVIRYINESCNDNPQTMEKLPVELVIGEIRLSVFDIDKLTITDE